jgi:hypothetical protein
MEEGPWMPLPDRGGENDEHKLEALYGIHI